MHSDRLKVGMNKRELARRDRSRDLWSAYLVKAPFDMPCDAPELIGTRVILEGEAFTFGGSIQNVPARPITKGDPMQILVSALGVSAREPWARQLCSKQRAIFRSGARR